MSAMEDVPLARLVETMDWGATPLGPQTGWSSTLATFVRLCLESRFPIILFWGPELVQIYNDAYRPILGARHPAALGQRAQACWPEIWDEVIGPMLTGVLERGESIWFENGLLPLEVNGYPEERYFTFCYSPIRDGNRVAGVFCAVEETTAVVLREREATERTAALAEIDRAKTAFYNNVSHELRTPLTLIIGLIEDRLAPVLRTGAHEPLAPELREDLETVARNGRRLLRLVNTLLDFSRLEANRLTLQPTPVDIGALTRELCATFRFAFESAGLRFTIHTPREPLIVRIDTRLWEHVVYNLLSNALKFTFSGNVAVVVEHDGERLRLVVRDSGVGVSSDDANHVFERFWRAPAQRARTHEGSGIGLAFVAEIARLHDGNVQFESTLGQGTTVVFEVPLLRATLPTGVLPRRTKRTPLAAPADIEASDASAGAYTLPTGNRGVPRVLIIDDNADLRAYMTRVLGEFYDVAAAGNGSGGFDLALRMRPDLILCDVMMPGIDGFRLVQQFRAAPTTSSVPIVLVSARADEDSAAAGARAGADSFLVKPFSSRELLLHVDRELTRVRVRDAESQRFRAIAETIPQIVWTADSDMHVESLSARFTEFTGVPVSEALGRGWESVVPPDHFDRIAAQYERGRQTGSMHFEFPLWHAASSRYRTVSARANPSYDATGSVVRWVGTLTDVDDDRRASERDHRASEAFQRASLPRALPRIPGLRFAADYRAAGSEAVVGGDWYDAFELNDGRVIVSVGDVMGSGIDSAVTMAAVRQSIRGAAQIHPDPVAILDAADRALHAEQPDRIVTAFVGVFEPVTGYFAYASAGHPPPVYRGSDGSILELTGSGLPLGLRSDLPGAREAPRIVRLEDRSLLVLYTDGLIECTRDIAFGERRLRAAVEAIRPASDACIATEIRTTVLDGQPQDDVAILTLTVDRSAIPADDLLRWTVPAGDAHAAMQVRRQLAAELRARGARDDDARTAELIFGELLGNAVRHTTGETEVILDVGHRYPILHVFDRGPGFSFMARLPKDILSDSGRGLFIAATLARDVSAAPRPDGGSHARAVFAFTLARARPVALAGVSSPDRP